MKSLFFQTVFLAFFLPFFISCEEDPAATPSGTGTVKSRIHTVYNWTWDDSPNADYDYADFYWNEITSDIANEGAVLIYVSNGAGAWIPLPRTIYPSTSFSQSQRYIYGPGGYTLIVQNSTRQEPSDPGVWTIKVLAVSSTQRRANPNLDWDDYEAVKEAFHLEE
jgi:hypothetical protein